MFSKVTLFVTSALALAAVAAPGGPTGGNECNVGTLQCCNSVQDSSSTLVQQLVGLLGIDVGDVTAQVGLTCNPISVIGVSGNNCNAQPACCSGNTFNSLVTLACTPINANL